MMHPNVRTRTSLITKTRTNIFTRAHRLGKALWKEPISLGKKTPAYLTQMQTRCKYVDLKELYDPGHFPHRFTHFLTIMHFVIFLQKNPQHNFIKTRGAVYKIYKKNQTLFLGGGISEV